MLNKGFIQQKMLKLSLKDKFSQIRLTECVADEGSRRKGHLRLMEHYEERQRNISALYVWKCKQFSMAEAKRRQSQGVLGKQWESSILREKVKRQARVNVQKSLYALYGRHYCCSSNIYSPFFTVNELFHI